MGPQILGIQQICLLRPRQTLLPGQSLQNTLSMLRPGLPMRFFLLPPSPEMRHRIEKLPIHEQWIRRQRETSLYRYALTQSWLRAPALGGREIHAQERRLRRALMHQTFQKFQALRCRPVGSKLQQGHLFLQNTLHFPHIPPHQIPLIANGPALYCGSIDI